MKTFTFIFFISLISLTFSCSSDDKADVIVLTKDGSFPISELVGTWEATKAQFSVNNVSIGVIEDGGTVSMTVLSDGSFTMTIDPVDRKVYIVSGEMFWEPFQQTFYFTIVWNYATDEWDNYGHTFDGTTLSLNGGTDTAEYDFNNDGNMKACSVHFIFERS